MCKMKFLKAMLTATAIGMMTLPASATTVFPADGFFKVSRSEYKPGNDGVFLYCDQTDAYKDTCYDVQFAGNGQVSDEKTLSKWRTADEYVKYVLGSADFEYVGMSPNASGIYLFYRKLD
ncbi:hypothetical protein [Alteromonas macleodii]|uniref:hypothetical protein n=1 Tax=Alteromonas macleodii TaxID=28108 RepID=UPI00314095B1